MNAITSKVILMRFAADVKLAAADLPETARHGRKVFVHHVWAWGHFEFGLIEFKAALVECHRLGMLTLSRCDLPEACDAHDVRRSGIEFMGATFNFLRLG